MLDLEQLLKEYKDTEGRFTWGSEYICFKPIKGEYIRIFARKDKKATRVPWHKFADDIVTELNQKRQK